MRLELENKRFLPFDTCYCHLILPFPHGQTFRSPRSNPARTSPTFVAKAPGKGPTMTFPVGGTAQRKRRRSFGRPINCKGLAVFTRQLATLVKAGMPILRSLEVLARQERRLAFKGSSRTSRIRFAPEEIFRTGWAATIACSTGSTSTW